MTMSANALMATLGIIDDPLHNRLTCPHALQSVQELILVFRHSETQEALMKDSYTNLWLEFLPWHSLN
jgi:hypothetical protein